ncbi:Lin1244/Lin1753 domain-containing protein [Enterococcus faecalis]|uniref:Lin1244/Lin1753 domain-containing protein n=1 Tax=Enterococcus faecalis TaxID=1351 RepID=UPI000666CC19|nr:Lin1244/Lin1753 domain-containing protein [Enterococcus faecalis]
MARPAKEGLDYFPLDVGIFEDEKIEAIAGEFGIKGELAAIKLLCAIYKKGYFILWDDLSQATLLKRLPGVSKEMLNQIVNRLVLWGFFDKELFDSVKVLTSENIQATFFEATKRRKTPKPTKYIVNVNSNSQSETVNADINTQSKVKESKVNKSKVNKKETESCINPSSPETSVEKAFFEEPLGEEKLTELIRYYSQNVSPATPVNITDLQYDLADFDGDLELLKEAVNICARNNERRYSYFAGILKNWRANGVKTYADYLNNERERADKKTQNKQYQNKPVRQEKVPEWMNQANGEEEKLSPEEQAEFERQMQELLGGE